MHRFFYIRKKSNLSKRLISTLLNVSVYTYMGYEKGRLAVPPEIEGMFAKMLGISAKEMLREPALFSKETNDRLERLAKLSEPEQKRLLVEQLAGKQNGRLSYREIQNIKQKIAEERNKEASD